MKRSITALAAAALLAGGLEVNATPLPTYSNTFGDAVTGDNEFVGPGPDNNHHWFINTGADSYANDFYERPTVQNYETVTATAAAGSDPELVVGNTYSAAGLSGPTYFQYLDIVQGRFGFDETFMYLAIELFGEDGVDNNGVHTSDFGESSYYRIRVSEDPNGAGGIMFSAEAAADFQKSEFSSFETEKAFAYLDTNRDVGGPGGISVVHEGSGSMNGYADKVISDGTAENSSGQKEDDVLFTRKTTSPAGRPQVEFAFDYTEFNRLFPSYAIEPIGLSIVFEANRGTQDNQNYLWNDKYSFDEAGTPYDPANEPQNVYELDTLRGTATVIPEPSAIIVWALLGSLGIVAGWRRRRRTGSATSF